MSTVAEIEEAIKKLEPHQVSEVASWLATHLQESSANLKNENGKSFDSAIDEVFNHFAPLLEELSK